MPAHRMAGDGHPRAIQLLKLPKDKILKLLHDVGLHVVALVPRFALGVDVEGGGGAEIPRVVLAREVETARRGVGPEDGEAEAGGVGVQEALFGAIVG